MRPRRGRFVRLGQEPAPGLTTAQRAHFVPDLRRSGELAAPLTALRRLEVLPSPPGQPAPEPTPPLDLAKVWPWIFPPADVYQKSLANVAASIAAGATLDVVFIGPASLSGLDEVPRGYRGVVKAFGHTAADFTNLTWTALIKNRPADPIVGLTFQFGALNLPTELRGPGIQLQPGDDLVVRVTNNGVGAVAGVRARMDFYLWRT